jgi:hypothetical protein
MRGWGCGKWKREARVAAGPDAGAEHRDDAGAGADVVACMPGGRGLWRGNEIFGSG